MAKTLRNQALSEPNPSIRTGKPAILVPEPEKAEPIVERLSIPVDPTSGRIVLTGMRESTIAKLKTALSDKTVQKQLVDGFEPADAAVNTILVNMLYDLLGSIAVIVARTRGISESAANALRYTHEEKAMFAAPTMAVLNKYNLLGGKYAEEIALVAAVGGVTAAHYMAMQQHVAHSEKIEAVA